MSRRTRIIALCLAALALAVAAGFALAQSIQVETEARALVYLHESGTIELGLEHDGERHLPERRFILSRHEPGRWLRSSPVAIAVDAPQPEPVTVEVEVPVEVPVEVIVEVPVEVPVEAPASVRPSDYAELELTCLEQQDEDGYSWTWSLLEDREPESFDTAEAVHLHVQYRDWAADGGQQRDEQAARWFAQCASYHGLDPTFGAVVATDPDDWMN